MSDLSPGSEFAGYLIEHVLGRGGMGVVYRAREQSLDRPVAIKLVSDAQAGDLSVRHRFEREARLMAAIDHPNVIPVYTAGEQDGHLYLVMRYVDGTDLQHQLRARGRLPPDEAARIVDQVARALDAAHARGLVHRDIKPANVLLSGDHVYLTDFGITRLIDERTRSTDSGGWIGTVDYMSPEQLRGESADVRSDVYSLGCLLYTCLAGTPPFHRETTAATITAQLHDRPPKVSRSVGVSRRFDEVLARALAKRPKHRYRSAGRLGTAALAAAQGGRLAGAQGRLLAGRGLVGGREVTAAGGGGAAVGRRPTRISPPTRRTVVRGEEQTKVDGPAAASAGVDAEPRTRWSARRSARSRPRTLAALAGAVLLAAVIAAVVVVAGGTSRVAPGPLTGAEISSVVQHFAGAYGDRDGGSLARLLAADVTRVDATGAEHGRAAVLREYERQFRTRPIPVGYGLSALRITPGWAGRARGRFTLTLRSGGTISGDVTFGLERIGGRVQIGLIATG